MDFDFHSRYSEYSNVELLKIILQKEQFQLPALKAAEGILAARNITGEEWAEAAAFIYGISKAENLKEQRREQISISITARLRMFLFPAENSTAQRIKVFSIVYLLYWIISSINIFREIFWMAMDGFSLALMIVAVIHFGYLLVVYWLYKLNKNGWVLLFLYSSFSAGFLVYMFYKWIDDNFKYYRITGGTIAQIIIYIFIFSYFNRKDVLGVLGINRRFQITILVICSFIFLLAVFQDFLNLSYYFG